MFLFLCSFSIAFWGCLVLFYFYLRFIKNFQIIWEEFPFFSQFFTIHLNFCGGLAIVRNPGCGSIYLLVALPTAIAVGSLGFARYSFTLFSRLLPRARSVRVCYSFTLPLGCCRGLAWICSLFASVCSGLAQHHIERHHEAKAHHKCYGGAV